MKTQEEYAAFAMQCSSVAMLQKGIDEVSNERKSAVEEIRKAQEKWKLLDERISAMQKQLRENIRDLRQAWKDEDEPHQSNI